MSSLSIPPPTVPTNASGWRSTVICRKLLYVCYYYFRCFGMTAFGIKRFKVDNHKNGNNLRVISNITSRRYKVFEIQPILTPKAQLNQETGCILQAYILKSMLWFHIVILFILCTGFTYGVLRWWLMDDYIFAFLLYAQLVAMIICPTLIVLVEISHRRRIIRALNTLFRLLQAIEELHCTYEVFQWTHVAFVALMVLTFIYEIVVCLASVVLLESWMGMAVGIVQHILLIEIWLNLHIPTLLYVCVDAMYGCLNHYLKHSFILRLKVIQTFGPVAPSMQVNKLQADFANFINLFKNVHHVGLELHYLCQIPVVCTLVSNYIGTISVIYYLIWEYFEADAIHVHYIPYTLKLVLDTVLLSLTAHRAIQSSQLVGCMGLENVVLEQNEEWHRQMEQFLHHINLYEFKLNCLGLFDITNAITLTFISGIFTSISIFLAFIIKTYRLQRFLEKQN